MKRQQLHERSLFDDEDRFAISQKSNGRCAHCGKQIMFGGQATVDHFIPLKKGGINRKCNLVMLCRECNQNKTSRIVDPQDYLRYLRPEAYEALNDYFQSYIHSFEYVSRGNLLCCDRYVFKVPLMYVPGKPGNKRSRAVIKEKLAQYYTLDRAYPEDIPKLEEFFISYLKKYNLLESEEVARKNIEFWTRFGAVYFVENQQKEVRMMIPITIATDDDGTHHLDVHIFSRYKGNNAFLLIGEIPHFIADRIMCEQGLPYLRVVTRILAGDNAGRFLPESMILSGGTTISRVCWMNNEYFDDPRPCNFDESEMEFYKCFPNIDDSLDRFFEQDENKQIEYMRTLVK